MFSGCDVLRMTVPLSNFSVGILEFHVSALKEKRKKSLLVISHNFQNSLITYDRTLANISFRCCDEQIQKLPSQGIDL